MSEDRRIKRRLLRKGSPKDEVMEYLDNLGNVYDRKWVAKISSFYNIIMGCFRNGFPVIVPCLFYNAWAFYPFFFIKKTAIVKDPISLINHERIHVRQQRDIHLVISVPLIVLSMFAEWFGWFNPFLLLCCIPFIPTLVYGIEIVRTWKNLLLQEEHDPNFEKITFKKVRENTCFERESIMKSTNAEYLYTRKFWAVLAFTGLSCFKHYGMN